VGEGRFAWSRRPESIEQEAKLDGIYVLRANEPAERLPAEDTVRSYKRLVEVGLLCGMASALGLGVVVVRG